MSQVYHKFRKISKRRSSCKPIPARPRKIHFPKPIRKKINIAGFIRSMTETKAKEARPLLETAESVGPNVLKQRSSKKKLFQDKKEPFYAPSQSPLLL